MSPLGLKLPEFFPGRVLDVGKPLAKFADLVLDFSCHAVKFDWLVAVNFAFGGNVAERTVLLGHNVTRHNRENRGVCATAIPLVDRARSAGK